MTAGDTAAGFSVGAAHENRLLSFGMGKELSAEQAGKRVRWLGSRGHKMHR